MDGDVQLRMLAPQLRDEAGRFRKVDPGKALDQLLLAWGEKAVAELRSATPVEEGEPLQRQHPPPGTARANWRFDHVPSQKAIKVTNTAVDERETAYARFLISGTGQESGGYIYPQKMPGFLIFYAKEGRYAGRKVWNRRVRGVKPVPALVAAIERLGPTAATMLNEKGVQIMQEIAGLDQ